MAVFNAIVALCLFGGALAQVPALGPCPVVETVPDFNVAGYMGRWYEEEKYFAASEIGASCIAADYSLNDDGTIKMVNSYKDLLGFKEHSPASARIPDASKPAELKISHPMMPPGVEGDYWVLGTDYNNYAVVYTCRGTKLESKKGAWILTRERNPSNEVIADAIAVAKRNQLQESSFSKTTQTGCEE